ncbi:efflux transporter outer membrane subunit [Tolumonas lignilytica]|uniref:efflux transporter outer membrane subunit n=1 Tax=Tolumonas lignilytica TaxID=1283284 RepID=UPI00046785B4|nr:TolC family protein [Tolumonas lignilytica]
MHKLPLSTITLALFLAACSTTPDPQAFSSQQKTNAGSFINQNPAQESNQSLPTNWWQLYQDPQLDGLITEAFKANTDLRIAQANLKKSQSILRQSEAAQLPETTLNGGVSYGNADQNLQDEQWRENAGLSLNWEADFGGRIDQAIKAASDDLEAQRAARDLVRVTVAAETTRAYLNACAYGYQQQVLQESLQNSQAQLQMIHDRLNVGAATELELASAESVVANVKAQLPMAQAAKQNAVYELAALLGRTPNDAPVAVAQCAMPPAIAQLVPVGDGTSLLRRRPDLRQAERQLSADVARVGVATADLYPRISFGASANYLHSDQITGSDSFSYGIGPLISWRFPNMVAARARLQQANAQAEASVASFDGKVLTAYKEVEQTLTSLHAVNKQNAELLTAQQKSERAYVLAKARYDAGAISYTELLVNQQAMLNASSTAASARLQLTNAQVDLFKALGGGWMQTSDTMLQ